MRYSSRKRNAEQSALTVHPGSTVKRDVYKAATAGLTGVAAFGALAVTGAVAGTAAHDQAPTDEQAAPQPAQVVTKRRKHRTVVRTRVVHAVSSGGVSSAGSGGVVRSTSPGGSAGGSSGGGSGGGSAATQSPPKPAAPAPAPSSGS